MKKGIRHNHFLLVVLLNNRKLNNNATAYSPPEVVEGIPKKSRGPAGMRNPSGTAMKQRTTQQRIKKSK
jgi:hypothetical protein